MSKHFNFLTACALVLVGSAGCAAPRPVALAPVQSPRAEARAESMEMWAQNHTEASRELGEWVKRHPEAAHRFFDWDGHHHDRAQHFVTWTLRHPNQSIDDFSLEHGGHWEEFDLIMQSHRPAAIEFMNWARRHPEAAEALMNHPGGLEWAGHHLYQDAWMMKHE